MCGIVGMRITSQSGFTVGQVDLFKEMLHIDTLRGRDSTGIVLVEKDNTALWVKQAAPPNIFERAKCVQDVYSQAVKTGKILIGHNRKATKGEINSNNAHPFSSGNIIMVHNGFLDNHEKYAKTDVDSEALCIELSKGDTPEEYEEILNTLSGAFSIVWYNVSTGNLHFFRNSQRPLHYIETNAGVFWASEKELVQWSVSKASLASTIKIEEFNSGYLYTLPFWGNLQKGTKFCTTVGSYGHGTAGWENGVWIGYQGQQQSKGGNQSGGKKSRRQSETQSTPSTGKGTTKGVETLSEYQGYKLNEAVCFSILSIKDGEAVTRCTGPIWIPGRSPMTAHWYIKEVQNETLKPYEQDVCLKAHIRSIVKVDDNEVKFYIDRVSVEPDLPNRDWLAHSLKAHEFEHLVGSISCAACHTVFHGTEGDLSDILLFHGIDYPSEKEINDLGSSNWVPGQYAHICAKCLDTYYNGKMDDNAKSEIVSSVLSGEQPVRNAA